MIKILVNRRQEDQLEVGEMIFTARENPHEPRNAGSLQKLKKQSKEPTQLNP